MPFNRVVAGLLAATSAPAIAEYTPTADRLIEQLQVTPKSATEVTATCNTRLAAISALQKAIESMPVDASPADLLAAYDDLYNLSGTTIIEPMTIKNVNRDAAIRKAAEDCQQRSLELNNKLNMSRPIFQRLQAVDRAGVAPELRYTVARQIDNYRRSGVDRDDATRKRIEELQNAITETSLEFERNINDDLRVVKLKPAELAGLPKDYLDAHKPGADGLVEIKMSDPEISPIGQYAVSSAVRKKIQTAWFGRAYPSNDAVLKRLFKQRAELASLLGYPNYAAYDLANRMAKDPARTQKFLNDIAAAARPIGEAEASRLLARLRKDDPTVERLNSWDSNYAMRLVRKEDFDVDPEQVREYFHFDKVRAGIFKLTEDLFEVQIRPWQTDTWSPEVGAYELVEDGRVIGRFFLDMHPRPNKYTHAAMFPLRVGIKDRAIPVASLVTNFPTGLMEHGQVETFLHEFGHLLHWLFAGQRPLAMQNFSEIENDVTEAPSTLLEEWVWDYDTLAKFASNAQGQPIPRPLVDKMAAGRNFGRAFGTMTQLGYAAVSLDYYLSDLADADLTARFKDTFGRYGLIRFPDEGHNQASFGHLTGYAASYYTYQWSEALAADLLSRFRSAGLRDTATARAYRENILAPGGSASMNDLARQFLGRDWSIDSYRRELEGGASGGAGAQAKRP